MQGEEKEVMGARRTRGSTNKTASKHPAYATLSHSNTYLAGRRPFRSTTLSGRCSMPKKMMSREDSAETTYL